MKIVNQLFEFVISIQLFFLFWFILNNYNNLSKLVMAIEINSVKYNISINFYALIGIMGVFFGIIIVSGLYAATVGVSDSGTQNIAKFLGFTGLFIILSFALVYELQTIPVLPTILTILIALIYVLKVLDSFLGDNQN